VDRSDALSTISNAGSGIAPTPVHSPPPYDTTAQPTSGPRSLAISDPQRLERSPHENAGSYVSYQLSDHPNPQRRDSFDPYNQNVPTPAVDELRINQQPRAIREMEIAPGGHRNAKGIVYGSDGDREWSYPLCSCKDDLGTCCLAAWCPCMVYSQNKVRLEHLTKYNSPEPGRNTGTCSSDCAIHACLIAVSYAWVLQMGTRASIRARYRIRGGGWDDCLTALFCTPCELTQESRELELEEWSLWGWARTGT